MIVMGDEMRRTQRGNNNAYSQDNETSWLDWTLLDKHPDVHRFLRLLIARRLTRDMEGERERLSLNQLLAKSYHAWHGVKLGQPDWNSYSHSLAFGADIPGYPLRLHLILNAYWKPLDFDLATPMNGQAWRRWIDTALDSPCEIVEWQAAPPVPGNNYRAAPRSVVVLASGLGFEES
jgi:glycogen operon protein